MSLRAAAMAAIAAANVHVDDKRLRIIREEVGNRAGTAIVLA